MQRELLDKDVEAEAAKRVAAEADQLRAEDKAQLMREAEEHRAAIERGRVAAERWMKTCRRSLKGAHDILQAVKALAQDDRTDAISLNHLADFLLHVEPFLKNEVTAGFTSTTAPKSTNDTIAKIRKLAKVALVSVHPDKIKEDMGVPAAVTKSVQLALAALTTVGASPVVGVALKHYRLPMPLDERSMHPWLGAFEDGEIRSAADSVLQRGDGSTPAPLSSLIRELAGTLATPAGGNPTALAEAREHAAHAETLAAQAEARASAAEARADAAADERKQQAQLIRALRAYAELRGARGDVARVLSTAVAGVPERSLVSLVDGLTREGRWMCLPRGGKALVEIDARRLVMVRRYAPPPPPAQPAGPSAAPSTGDGGENDAVGGAACKRESDAPMEEGGKRQKP